MVSNGYTRALMCVCVVRVFNIHFHIHTAVMYSILLYIRAINAYVCWQPYPFISGRIGTASTYRSCVTLTYCRSLLIHRIWLYKWTDHSTHQANYIRFSANYTHLKSGLAKKEKKFHV